MGPDLLPDRPGQPLGDLLFEPRVRRFEQRHAGVYPVELDVHQGVILLRDLVEQPLAAAPHDRLEEPRELGRRQALERPLEQRRLEGLRDAWRFQRHADALVRLYRPRHRLHHLPVALDHAHVVRFRRQQQSLGVVARHGGALHRACSRPASRLARYSVTRRRLASESRFAAISFDAAAIERSTASRRSSRIAFSFSASISLRARPSSCSYSWRALASSVSRSFSATDLALATISCASARAPAIVRLCSSSSRTASARARSASSNCCWMRRSRSSTDLSNAGKPSFHSRTSRIPKTTMVQKISPVLMENGVNASSPPAWAASWTSSSSGIYSSLKSSANTSDASPTPSINAAVRIIAPRISPDASGWRAIASTAWPPIRPIPSPTPMTASPSPRPAPSSALAFFAAAAISASVGCAP